MPASSIMNDFIAALICCLVISASALIMNRTRKKIFKPWFIKGKLWICRTSSLFDPCLCDVLFDGKTMEPVWFKWKYDSDWMSPVPDASSVFKELAPFKAIKLSSGPPGVDVGFCKMAVRLWKERDPANNAGIDPSTSESMLLLKMDLISKRTTRFLGVPII